MTEQQTDFGRINRNIGRLIQGGAPRSAIDEYLGSEGVSTDQVRQVNYPQGTPGAESPAGWRQTAFGTGSVMGNDSAWQQAARGFVQGIPSAARFGGLLFSGGDPLVSEAAGQAGDLTKEALLTGVQNKPFAVRGGQAALNIALQLPFTGTAKGFTPQLEEALAKSPEAAISYRNTGILPDWLQQGLQQTSGRLALKSSGLTATEARQIMATPGGIGQLGFDMERQGIVTAASSRATSALRAQQQVASNGKQLEGAYSTLDKQLAEKFTASPTPENTPLLDRAAQMPDAFIARLRDHVTKTIQEDVSKNPLERAATQKSVDTLLDSYYKAVPGPTGGIIHTGEWGQQVADGKPLSFTQLWQMRRQVDPKAADWKAFHLGNDLTGSTLIRVDLRNMVQDETLRMADSLSGELGNVSAGDNIRALNRRYAVATLADDLFTKGAAKQYVKQAPGIKDYAAAGAGALVGGAPGAIGTAVVSHLLANHGNQAVARGAYWVAKIADIGPAGQSILGDYVRTASQQTGRELMPHDVPQYVWNAVKAAETVAPMKPDGAKLQQGIRQRMLPTPPQGPLAQQ